jgi:cell wall-associated NlpC family hydrolase
MRLPLNDARLIDLLAWWGTPYSYGAGRPSDALTHWPPAAPPRGVNGGAGIDCSGFAQVALVRLGLLASAEIDRSAAALFDLGSAISLDHASLGDLVFYGPRGHVQHVVLYIAPGVILGADGGTSTTNGNDPRAFVRLDRLDYRPDFLGARRMPLALKQATP